MTAQSLFLRATAQDLVMPRYRHPDGTSALSGAHIADGLTAAEQRFNSSGAEQYTLRYYMDESGEPVGIGYQSSTGTTWTNYYFAKNAQGDVMALYQSVAGNNVYNPILIARYTYDAWGNLLSVTNSNGAPITSTSSIAIRNPFRYRGYHYDTDTGFYYLQSRYYDPAVGRFINADAFAYTGQGFLGYNMFAYCLNNPIIHNDTAGTDAYVLINRNGAVGFGHMGFIAQDDEGEWWHFYWGMEYGICFAPALLNIDVGVKTWCVKLECGEPISLEGINASGQYDKGYDDMLYIPGDFSVSVERAKSISGDYNLYRDNCAQLSLKLLMESETNYMVALDAALGQAIPIPNEMFDVLQQYLERNYIPSSGPGGGGKGTYNAFH